MATGRRGGLRPPGVDPGPPDPARRVGNDLLQWAALDDTLTEGVTCPTLVLHGSHDGDVDPAHARHAAASIPNATLHIVADGWHILPLSTNGDTAADAVRGFLDLPIEGHRPRTPRK